MLTLNEVAAIKNTTIKRVRRDAASGALPSIKNSNRYRVRREDADIWQPSLDGDKSKSMRTSKNADVINWVDVSAEMKSVDAYHNPDQATAFNFIDLYAGAGGLSCGLTMAGFRHIAAIEIVAQAVATYNRNFKTRIKPCSIREEQTRVDVINSTKRVIFIGNRLGEMNLHPSPIFAPNEYKIVADGIERFMSMPEDAAINHIFSKHSEEMKRRLTAIPEGQSLYTTYNDGFKKVRWNAPSITVKENHGGVHVHPKLPRVMTPRELAALQSFPDAFIFEGTKNQQLVQIGNAVPPLLGKAVGLAIIKALNGR